MKRLQTFVVVCAVAMLVALPGCQRKTIEPVSIEANDMCSFCRMSISEKRYASEFIDGEDRAFKFDDIGCMVNFIKQKRSTAPVRATFTMDFERREWIKAEDAFYVRSSEFKTPMNGGVIAFNDQPSAQAAATKYQGTLLRFEELTK